MTAALLSQVVAEVLRQNSSPSAVLSQVVAEVLRQNSSPSAVLSQVVVEVLRRDKSTRVSKLVSYAVTGGSTTGVSLTKLTAYAVVDLPGNSALLSKLVSYAVVGPVFAPRLRIGRRLDGTLPLIATLDEIRLTVGSGRNLSLTQTAPWPEGGQVDPDSTDIGWVDITAHRATFTNQVKRFTVTKAKQGAPGTAGDVSTITGPLGPRGTVNVSRAITGTSWSDTEAALAILIPGYGVPQARDIVTLFNTLAGYSESRFYDSTTSSWLALTQYINGNLLVDGTISASKIVAGTITTDKLVIGAASDGVKSGRVIFNPVSANGSGLIDSTSLVVLEMNRGSVNSFVIGTVSGNLHIKLKTSQQGGFGGLSAGHYLLYTSFSAQAVNSSNTSEYYETSILEGKVRVYMDADDIIQIPINTTLVTPRINNISGVQLRYHFVVRVTWPPGTNGGANISTILNDAWFEGGFDLVDMKV